MSGSNDFDAAIDEALVLSARHEGALRLVQSLTRELAASVQSKTAGLVTVDLIPKAEMPRLEIGSLFGFQPEPRIGKDKEDKQVEQFVVAVAKDDRRALWEVQFDDTGYPVILRGPLPDTVVTCFHEADVRGAFLDAARSGLVGRKLSALAAHAGAKDRQKPEALPLPPPRDAKEDPVPQHHDPPLSEPHADPEATTPAPKDDVD